MKEVQNWLISWFKNNKGVEERPDIHNCNYFESGFIDSFGVVELIMEIESKYTIRFSQNHFQDRRFATIDGLAEIIMELQK